MTLYVWDDHGWGSGGVRVYVRFWDPARNVAVTDIGSAQVDSRQSFKITFENFREGPWNLSAFLDGDGDGRCDYPGDRPQTRIGPFDFPDELTEAWFRLQDVRLGDPEVNLEACEWFPN